MGCNDAEGVMDGTGLVDGRLVIVGAGVRRNGFILESLQLNSDMYIVRVLEQSESNLPALPQNISSTFAFCGKSQHNTWLKDSAS